MRLKDKVAIVAGAGWGGIGAATAMRFVQEGAKVVINALPGEERLFETEQQLRAIGGAVVTVPGDVSQASTWQALVGAAVTHFGKLTTLMHNAAHAYIKPALDFTEAEWNHAFAVSLTGPWLGAKHCVPEMVKAGGGSLVFTSTVNSLITNPGFGVYSSSKAGLNGLTRSIAMEYGRSGIRCNAIAPGLIVGARQRDAMKEDPLEDQMNTDLYPVGRYGEPEDIANVALFLASDEAAFVTGIVLVADGGLTLQSPEAIARPAFRKRWRNTLLVPQPITPSA
ncbi:MAG: SDR family oxidoreductase [Caldilineaceae bacterium]|nr:SDR family oxidoreductase [Caldilineaceae bacterium]